MARKNGFEAQADFFGNLMKQDPTKITMKSLEEAAEFYLQMLIPNIPESLFDKEHAKDHVKVEIGKKNVQVAFENTAYYWRFPENGTVDQKAQRFASKTYKKHSDKIAEIMTRKIMNQWKG
ncbi:hypothetical protein FDP56_08985 [Enterococcus casseliflavus]|uniref:HK97-gp10 family putative phage morphogenesis protein n=1 Tax=Enterococcus casseliflavus TaxID=37734 RepID=UPI00129CEAD1|nr:HK97-gp10 family putative phage morphogenesis protein [Enterococcus casseliflavus]MRI70549.1 hypothetical protein [Enterococcus casseliflavus]